MRRVCAVFLMVAGIAGVASAEDSAAGAKVFADQKCSLCHSVAGKGNAKGPLDDVGSKLSAADIRAWIDDANAHDREDGRHAQAGDEAVHAPEGRCRLARRLSVDAQEEVVTRLAGAVLTTISAVLFLVVFLADLFGCTRTRTSASSSFCCCPVRFCSASRSCCSAAGHARGRASTSTTRRSARPSMLVFALTIANVVIVSLAAYRGVEYMDSVAFCGQVCHTVMKPEFVGHQSGPHANVKCVDCHVAPGASGFVAAKTAGTRRLLASSREPIRRRLFRPHVSSRRRRKRASSAIRPQLAHGDRIRDVVEYADNEKNVASTTKLKMHVGGIHRHNAQTTSSSSRPTGNGRRFPTCA